MDVRLGDILIMKNMPIFQDILVIKFLKAESY